jgi:hypothetical protein
MLLEELVGSLADPVESIRLLLLDGDGAVESGALALGALDPLLSRGEADVSGVALAAESERIRELSRDILLAFAALSGAAGLGFAAAA